MNALPITRRIFLVSAPPRLSALRIVMMRARAVTKLILVLLSTQHLMSTDTIRLHRFLGTVILFLTNFVETRSSRAFRAFAIK